MKKDKSHDRDEADCRAELILINGDCTDPANNTPALLLEANGKPSAPGESCRAVPGVLHAWDVQGCMGPGISQPPSQRASREHHSRGRGHSMTPLGFCFLVAHPGHGDRSGCGNGCCAGMLALPLDGLTPLGRREAGSCHMPKGCCRLHHSSWDALVIVPKCQLLGS